MVLKVLQINNVYGTGSTGKLTQIIHQALQKDGIESVVLYGRGASVEEADVHRVCSNAYGKANSILSRITGIRYGGCILSTARIIDYIKKENPNIVHLQCINGNFVNVYKLITWLKKRNIPTVLTLHAEFMYTANCGHAFDCEKWKNGCGKCPRRYAATKSLFFDRTHSSFAKMTKAFSNFQDTLSVVSVSPWLMERAMHSTILAGKEHCVILNGVDTNIFYPRITTQLENQYRAQEKKIIFQATAMFRDAPDDPKGGVFFLELAKHLRDLPVIFLVAGKYEVHHTVPENVILLGEITDQNLLAEYYSLAELTVLTSKRETYSMVCAESLCCGTPVLGFCAGAPEMISLPQYSRFVPYGDMDALERHAREMLQSRKTDSRWNMAEKAKTIYAKEIMVQQYKALYRRIKCRK